MKLLLIPLLLYLLFAAMVYLNQRKLIYYPSNYTPASVELLSEGMRFWPSEADYRGFTMIDKAGGEAGTFVLFHGNASLAHDRAELARQLHKSGFDVVLAEYPAYGKREGSLSETSLVNDAVKTVQLIQSEFSAPIYLWGESLGSGVAAGVAAVFEQTDKDVSVEGVVLQVPFDSLVNVAQHHYWYLPARWLIKDKYDSTHSLKGFGGRVAVVVAEQDNVIPAEFGIRLFESVDADKELWMVKGSGHAISVDGNSPWLKELIEFMSAPQRKHK